MRNHLLILLGLLSCSATAQSPWARNKAGFYAQAGYNFIPTYGTLFAPKGEEIILDHEVSERQFQFYGEYGLLKKTTLVVSIPWVFTERGDDNPDSPLNFAQEARGKLNGLGNATLAIRHQFRSGKLAMAGTLRVAVPSARDYVQETDLRTGYHAWTVQPMLSAGMGFKRAYGFLYGSYGLRTNKYSHFVNLGLETGLKIGPVWLTGFSELVYSLENGERALPSIDVLTGLYANDQGWLSLGIKAIWEINRFCGISISGAGAAWAQHVPKSPGIGASAYFKWE